jgi:hypothetical protein
MWIVTLPKFHLLHEGEILVFDHARLLDGKLSVISSVILSPPNALFERPCLPFRSSQSCPLYHAIIIPHIFEKFIYKPIKFVFSLVLVKLLLDIHTNSPVFDVKW